MKNIQSISGQTDYDTKKLAETFKWMSTQMDVTTDSAQNLAEAFYDIQSSGFDAAHGGIDVLFVATKAASAGLTTTKVAAEGIVAVLNAYGLSADKAAKISDIMFQTVNRGVGTFEELNSAIGQVLSLSSTLGVGFDEVAASLATMSKQGINFNEGSTALNAALTALISPTDTMKKAFKDLGYESGSAMIEALGFAGTMQKLSEYSGGSAEKMQALFGNVRALKAALALTGEGAQMFADDLAAMGESTGATQKAFDIQMKSFAAAWANFQNTVGVALMEIGDILLPFLANLLANYITPLVKWFIALDDSTQGWIIAILAVVAAIGPLLFIFGQIAGAISAIMTIWPALVAAFSSFGTVIALIMSPLGLFVAAVAIAVAAIMGNWFGLRDALVGSVGAIVSAVSQVGDAFKGVGSMIAEGWSKAISVAGTSLSQLGQIVWKRLSDLGNQMIQIGYLIIKGLIKGILKGAIDLIATVLGISQQIQTAIKKSLGIASPSKVFMDIGQNVVAGFNQGIESMGGGLGVNVPQAQGGNSRNPSLAVAGATGGAGGVYQTYNVYAAPGSTDAQVRDISQKLAKLAKKKGAKGL